MADWTVQFDSLFNMLDASGQLSPANLVELVIEDQCGKTVTHPIEVFHPVAFDDELCPLEIIGFPMFNDGIPISDVLYGGVSILNTTACPSPISTIPAFSPGPQMTCGPSVGKVRNHFLEDL